MTTLDLPTFLGGCTAVFIGWMTYVVRFVIMKQPFMQEQRAKS